ncbi:uncharacterized protein LOC123682561 [Harmonia axyridis]|uniref:uncharacterized protein LOC123682561 n=1 Tax=Harmonia axyridis TaxID=115357 RepID=UPI001E274F75|nr:uncharacterized protein LOC123682561 [Harmonia axyridis]
MSFDRNEMSLMADLFFLPSSSAEDEDIEAEPVAVQTSTIAVLFGFPTPPMEPLISYPHQFEEERRSVCAIPLCTSDIPFALFEIESPQSSPDQSGIPDEANMAACYSPYELPAHRTLQVPVEKDYSKPLHVDCSVEYELPNTAKPPQGVKNEPLLMIHPCYFRKIESQHRSPFVNNLPVRTAVTPTKRARIARGQQIPQQVPHQGAQYPVHFTATERQIWDQLPPLVPINRSQNCCAKRDLVTTCASYTSSSSSDSRADSGIWTDPERSPDRPEDKHILSGKYRQYLRAHRLHPYVTSAIPLASTFPQMQQVCYNV